MAAGGEGDAELLVNMKKKDMPLWCDKNETSCPFCEKTGVDVFRRLAMLPNIADKKYTLGRHYTSREEQGEFIFCDVEGMSPNQAGYFEIKCGDAGFTMRALEGACDVALNGRALSPQDQPVLLKFGDQIQLGPAPKCAVLSFRAPLYEYFVDWDKMSSCLRCMDEKAQSRTITAAESNTSDDEIRQVTPLDNPLILHEIMALLPTRELRKARFVSPFWNAEATHLLMKRTVLPLYLSSNDPKRWQSLFYWHTQIRPYFRHSGGLKFHTKYDEESNRKMIDDLNSFFLPLAPQLHITTLHLDMNMWTPLGLEILMNILESTSPHLHSLDLQLTSCPENVNAPELDRVRAIAFPSLRRLRLYWGMMSVEADNEEERRQMWIPLLETFIQSQMRLEAFEIFSSDSQACERSLKALQLTPLLRELIVRYYWDESLHPTSSGVLERLNAFPPNQLTHLELQIDEVLAQALSTFLHQQALSLRKLRLMVPQIPRDSSMEMVAFPTMPVLKSLDIYYDSDVHPFRPGRVTFPDCEGEVINYSRIFPQLQTLRVHPDYSFRVGYDHPKWRDEWLKYKAVMGVWFPLDDEEPSRMVVRLDVPYYWKNKKGQTLLTTGVDWNKLRNAFPYAVLPEVENALRDREWIQRELVPTLLMGLGGMSD